MPSRPPRPRPGLTSDPPNTKTEDALDDKSTKKRRSERACKVCHYRKVKCNFVPGSRCNACVNRQEECVEFTGKRQKKQVYVVSKPGKLAAMNTVERREADTKLNRRTDLDRKMAWEPHENTMAFHPMISNAEAVLRSLEYQHTSTAMTRSCSDSGLMAQSRESRGHGFPRHHASGIQPRPYSMAVQTWRHPPFPVKPLPHDIEPRDRHHLWSKGALYAPRQVEQDALVKAYVEFVYPSMPMLDLRGLLSGIYGPARSHPAVSLLLYQAVLSSAIGFVDIAHVAALGFRTRTEAHRHFYQKTKVRSPPVLDGTPAC